MNHDYPRNWRNPKHSETKFNMLMRFGWGYDFLEELIIYSDRGKVLKPQKIDFPSEEKVRFIIDISCGFTHTLVLLENCLIYGWGWNGYGQLGLVKERMNNKAKTH